MHMIINRIYRQPGLDTPIGCAHLRHDGVGSITAMASMGKPWFVPKRYGYGATPTTWQGWAAIVASVAILGLVFGLLGGWRRWICGAAVIAAFAAIARAKTDGGWRWRWGRRD